MFRSRKAESNVIAEIIMVGIAVTLSTVIFLAMADDDTAGDFGSLIGTFESSSEILSIGGLVQKCPTTDASVIVKNTGGLDANVRAIAINDATNNTNANAKYHSSASSFSLVNGSTSGLLNNAQCNDATYLNIASVFLGTAPQDVVSNMNFTSNINGWTSSSSASTTLTKFYLTMNITQNGNWNGDYRKLSLTSDLPNSGTIITFGTQKDKHFLFKPGQANLNPGNPNNNPTGFGWRTASPLDATISNGTWEFGLTLTATNVVAAQGHIEIRVFSADLNQNLNQASLLFSLDTATNVLGSQLPTNYTFTHNPGLQFNLANRVLIVEYWLHVTDNNGGPLSSIALIIGPNSYVSIPIIPTIDVVVHDPLTGNPSPGSGAGSAKGVVTDLTTYVALGTINYNFIYQFVTPAGFNSMSASYAWSYSATGILTDTKLKFVKLIITDLNGSLITELHCNDGAGSCDGNPGWTQSPTFTYTRGISSAYALSPSTNYRLVVQFQVANQAAIDTPIITLRVDDVGLEFANGQHEASAIFTGTSSQTSPSNIKLFFDSTFTTTGVNVTLQAFDYTPTVNAFSTTSEGKQSYVFATPSSDYIVTKDLLPSKFMSSGQWQLKVTATYGISFTMSIDLVQVNAIVSKPVLREVVYLNNVVIEPGKTILVNATLSRSLDTDTAYKVKVVTERNSYSAVILN